MTEAVEAEKLSRFASDKFSAFSDKRDEPTFSDKRDEPTSNIDINVEGSKSKSLPRTTRYVCSRLQQAMIAIAIKILCNMTQIFFVLMYFLWA